MKSNPTPLLLALLPSPPASRASHQPRITGFTLTTTERRGQQYLALTLQVGGDRTPRPDWQWFYHPAAYDHAKQAGQAVVGLSFKAADEALSAF